MVLISDELARTALARSEAREAIVADTATRYWFYPATNDSAETLVFIHGYRGNHHGLEAIAGALPDFNIVIPDLPGFGASAPFAGVHSVDAYVAWLNAFIAHIAKELKLNTKPVLVGHSFGSIVSAAYAAQSTAISHLVLINPVSAPALEGPKAALTKLVRLMFWLSGALPLKSGLAILKSWPMVRGMSIVMTKSWNGTLRKWVHAQHDANFNDFANRRVAIEGYNASISHNVSDYAADFTVPTTLIIGAKDDITSVKQQLAMAHKIPVSWNLVTLRGVGHLTHYEKPLEVASAMRLDLLEAEDESQ
jgi:pimeloyl-ACP methyl ester carboxylesterase